MEKYTLLDLIQDYPTEKQHEKALTFLGPKGEEVKKFSYLELEQQCKYVAQNLQLFSNNKEIVLIALEEQDQFVLGFFGCIFAGKIPAPLAPLQVKRKRNNWGRVVKILKQQPNTALLIAENQFAAVTKFLADSQIENTRIYTIESLLRPTSIAQKLPAIERSSIAYIQYTSGSTSSPKGIMLTHEQVLTNLAKMYRVFDRGVEVRVSGWIPFHHDMGLVGHLFTVLYESGFGVFMSPTTFLAKPEIWLRSFKDYACNSGAAPTFAFDHCVNRVKDLEGLDLSTWANAYVGSETVSLKVLNRFSKAFGTVGFKESTFRPVYGLAETTLLAAGGSKGLDQLRVDCKDHSAAQGEARTLVPYTIDSSVTTLSIHNLDSGEELSEGQIGEIWLKGAHNFAGYLTPDTSFDALKSEDVKTGDLGFIEGENLYFTGRLKEVLIVRGANYAAQDVEHCVRLEHVNLSVSDETVCVQYADSEGDNLVVLQEVHRHTTAPLQKEIIDQIKANLADGFGIKAETIALIPQGTLPRTENHKIARIKCLEQFNAGALQTLSISGIRPNVQKTEPKDDDDGVVIVGMAVRFPGQANTLEKYWELLANGDDAIVEVPEERWDNSLFYDEGVAVPGKVNTKWGGFVDKVDEFDPRLFGITGFEASEIDPQQRLVMETSWRLLENCGWTKEAMKSSRTGVYIGISTNDYLYMKIKLTNGLEGFNAYAGLGNAHSIAANRVSYFYDLNGPSMAIDTACSSSLTAFHLAAKAIENGDCTQAIVGGVNAMLTPGSTVTLSQFGMMAPDGRCKAFDASADGYVRAEGCGLVMLKSKSAAIRDGDVILANVLGSHTSQDGKSQGITYPNGSAQLDLITETIQASGISGKEISYVEAHGTGTASGDPIELEQIIDQYGSKADTPCYVGSVKANIGHLEAGAGIAGVIKTVLMMQKKQIPPQIHVNNLNPKIDLKSSRIRISDALIPWESESDNRKAAVSSFGFGGSLAHVILEESVHKAAPETSIPNDHFLYPFILSGHSQASLNLQVDQWISWLQTNPVIPFHDLCATQANCRSMLSERLFLLASDKKELLKELEVSRNKKKKGVTKTLDQKLCFLFTGAGEHFIDMGRSLYYRYPQYQAYYDSCINSLNLDAESKQKLAAALAAENADQIVEAQIQPMQFALQYALARFLMDLNLAPDYLLGYSFGEYVAACLAGCFDMETGMAIVHKRGQLMDALPSAGSMATIFEGFEEVEKVVNTEEASIAVLNSPNKTVVSGRQGEISRICEHFKEKNVQFYYLKTIRAYHSRFVDPMLDEFTSFLQGFTFREPTKKWLSSVTGDWMNSAPDFEHWINQTRNAVLFSQAASKLGDLEEKISYIEVGPGASTLSAIFDCLKPRGVVLARTIMQRKEFKSEDYFINDSLGKLYEIGFDVNWSLFYKHTHYPSYIPGIAFEHKPYWIKGMDAAKLATFVQSDKASDENQLNQPNLAQSKDSINEEASVKKDLHYTVSWNKGNSLDSVKLGDVLEESIIWILVGEPSPLMTELVTKLKTGQKTVFWLGNRIKGGLKPDIELSRFPDQAELFKKIDKIVNYLSNPFHDKFRVLFLSGVGPVVEPAHQIENLNDQVRSSIGTYTNLLKAIKELVFSPPVWVITQGVHSIKNGNNPQSTLGYSPLWGYASTAYLEHPELRGGLIDTSISDAQQDVAEAVIKKVFRPQQERCVLIREGVEYIEKIDVTEVKDTAAEKELRSDGAYIITGGLGGLGISTANWLVGKGIKHLVLISRKELPEQDAWDTLSDDHKFKALAKNLIPIRDKVDRLDIVSMDIRDIEKLRELFGALAQKEIPVRGVIHAAGINYPLKIVDTEIDDLLETVKIKIASSWALHQITQDMDLDCFILFSSVSALWGSANLSHYTAANYYMDMLARYRKSINLTALSIDWGPWGEVGMSSEKHVTEILEKLGFALMSPKKALRALDVALVEEEPFYLISDVDWKLFKPFVDFSLRPSLFENVAEEAEELVLPASEGLLDILDSTAELARKKIEDVVRMELRSVMLVESAERLDDELRFNFMGMDSLMAISFVVELEQYFNIKLPNTMPYNYPHIKAVSDYLFEVLYLKSNPEPEGVKKSSTSNNGAPNTSEVSLRIEGGNWFRELRNTEKELDHLIYCFPPAGSGVSIFEPLVSGLPQTVGLIGIQLPGREDRSEEKMYGTVEELMENLVNAFTAPEVPYSLFGHSFGGLLAYEFYIALEMAGKRLPESIIVSAKSPALQAPKGNLHQLSDEEMVHEIIKHYESDLNEDSREQAIMSIIDVVRADFKILETHQSQGGRVKIPMTAIAASNDAIAPPHMVEQWKELCDDNFQYHKIEGNHDLIRQNSEELNNIIELSIGSVLNDQLMNER
jgi:acyl transferase domain-containing protein/acyl-CoA synthetase (AMP-forming)/AMP-acid ligase II/surfactin synthase thioesterase subunit/acyl carrier protein